jgi:hypothetical protein
MTIATTATVHELILNMARKSRRGIAIPELVIERQDWQHKLDLLETSPDEAIGFERDSHFTREDWTSQHRELFQANIEAIQAEIQRRRDMALAPRTNTDPEIIETIKSRLPIVDVMGWYSEVFYSNRNQMKFRCNLHGDGQDKNPSGVIYVNESRYWCFVCNKGGDIFDAVQAWGGCDLSMAIAKLARYLGLDTQPLIKTPRLTVKGGAIL